MTKKPVTFKTIKGAIAGKHNCMGKWTGNKFTFAARTERPYLRTHKERDDEMTSTLKTLEQHGVIETIPGTRPVVIQDYGDGPVSEWWRWIGTRRFVITRKHDSNVYTFST